MSFKSVLLIDLPLCLSGLLISGVKLKRTLHYVTSQECLLNGFNSG